MLIWIPQKWSTLLKSKQRRRERVWSQGRTIMLFFKIKLTILHPWGVGIRWARSPQSDVWRQHVWVGGGWWWSSGLLCCLPLFLCNLGLLPLVKQVYDFVTNNCTITTIMPSINPTEPFHTKLSSPTTANNPNINLSPSLAWTTTPVGKGSFASTTDTASMAFHTSYISPRHK